ncbi:endodeoxyribonuclease-like protein [Podospora conica]|nr:endodeoxyribonuclease-like protein [Schizothecium conicum]
MATTSNSSSAPPSDYKPRYIDVSRFHSRRRSHDKKQPLTSPRHAQIGINLADPIFRGRYHGKSRHPDDLTGVVQRAVDVGCTKLIVTGSSFKSSRDALKLAAQFPSTVYTTAGIHPCSSSIFSSTHHHHHDESQSEDEAEHTPACGPDPSQPPAEGTPDPSRTTAIITDLHTLITTAGPSLVALGEFGLDYDRLHYCPAPLQLHSFAAQLSLAASLTPQLPLFLHSRAAHRDFVRLLQEAYGERLERLTAGGVVHSFTGTVEELRELMELGLYIGINGCSFKTAENCDVVREVRLDRLMLETDGPWCEVRASHEGWKYLVEAHNAAQPPPPPVVEEVVVVNGEEGKGRRKQGGGGGKKNQKKEPEVPERFKVVKKEKWEEGAMVKGRNEPCTIERIATIVAGIKGVSVEEVCEAAWANTVKVFGVGA